MVHRTSIWCTGSAAALTVYGVLDHGDLPLDGLYAEHRVGARGGYIHLALGSGETLQVGRAVAAVESVSADAYTHLSHRNRYTQSSKQANKRTKTHAHPSTTSGMSSY